MPTSLPPPLLSCRLYPGGALYYRFNVWPSKEALGKHVHWARLGRKVPGVCSTYETFKSLANGRFRKSLCCGEVNVVKRGLGVEILSHEIAHAALGWAERKRINPLDCGASPTSRNVMPIDSDQELFCYALGRMMRQAVRALYRAKVWP